MTSKPHSDKGPRGIAPLICEVCNKPCTARGHFGSDNGMKLNLCGHCGSGDVEYHTHFGRDGYCLSVWGS